MNSPSSSRTLSDLIYAFTTSQPMTLLAHLDNTEPLYYTESDLQELDFKSLEEGSVMVQLVFAH